MQKFFLTDQEGMHTLFGLDAMLRYLDRYIDFLLLKLLINAIWKNFAVSDIISIYLYINLN